VLKFYESAGYALAWTRNGVATSQAKALIGAFEAAETKGLNPRDYAGSLWNARLAAMEPGAHTSDAMLADFDLAVTVSAMRYVSDLHFGRANLSWRANHGVYHSPGGGYEDLADLAFFLRQSLVNAPDVNAALRGLEPPYPGYRRTQRALQAYLAMAREGVLPLLPGTAKTIEPGSAYAATPQLAVILRRLGDLSNDPGNGSNPDPGIEPGRYDGALVDAVKQFQMRHELEQDGRLGKSTVAQLNTPLNQRILQLKLTMERWRWVPHGFSNPPIVVNIPEFRLRALNAANLTDLEMKVVVGSAYGGHETPAFAADMKSVVFRPYWDVPVSIARAELAPKITKDAGYLAKNRYEVVNDRGQVVSGATVDGAMLGRIRSGQLRVRQMPGPDNALGLVKFLFPNEHDVYLHSTPATELFSKTRRDFSHGCIRVENPEDLAVWVLRNQRPGWTPERVRDAMNSDTTDQVTLDKPIPVLIVYATAVVLENGEVRFFDDIYKQDTALERMLGSGRRSLQ
jgi:murein L,D-transpeptidase YcbB/YkuD